MSHGTVLHLDQVTVGYPGPDGWRPVVQVLSLELPRGEIGALLGASGCGKTTALRAIAGFEPVAGGRIVVGGSEVARPGHAVPPESRRVGMMFQDYALFPHLDVAANIGFGIHRLPSGERAGRVQELLELVGLVHAARMYPHELSGGQQQRVALARALAPRPALILLDEPFSSLDGQMRTRLAADLRQLLKATGTTSLLVTHDQSEAFAMADRVGVMAQGRLLQWASPAGLYRAPATHEVATFIGRGVLLPGGLLGQGSGRLVLVRPGDLRLDPGGPLAGVLREASFRGPHYEGRVELPGGHVVEVDLGRETPFPPGSPVTLSPACSDLPSLPATTAAGPG